MTTKTAKFWRLKKVGYKQVLKVPCTREQAMASAAKGARKYFQSLLKDGMSIEQAIGWNRDMLAKLKSLDAPRILIVERSRRIAWLIALRKLGSIEARMALRKKILKLHRLQS